MSEHAYSDAGVDYETLDAGKRAAVVNALATSPLLLSKGGRAIDASRGQPAFVFEHDGKAFAFVIECLGTKSMIAREVMELLAIDRFADIAYDAVAAIVNDLCCVGALPLVVSAYFATGSASWYEPAGRFDSLLCGWRKACEDAGCTWGGGESPTLAGMLSEPEIELAGSAVGAFPASSTPILGDKLAAGDEIVLIASSGLHANGASLARLLASELDEGYATQLADGKTFGEHLLTPSLIYAPLVAALLDKRLPITYMSHITGHGLLKLMRAKAELAYRITALPPAPPVLDFLVSAAGLDAAAAYSTFNMGVGYAIYCAEGSGADVLALAQQAGYEACLGGKVEDGARAVILEPVGVRYASDALRLG